MQKNTSMMTTFMCIDKAHADFKEPKIGFLAAYRLALFQVDQYRLGKHLQKQKEEREQKAGKSSGTEKQ